MNAPDPPIGRPGCGPVCVTERAAAPRLLAGGFLLLAIGFVAAPRLGGRLYGLNASIEGLDYVRALGFRDAGLAAMLALAAGDRSAVRAVGIGGAAIPLLDALLVSRRKARKGLPAIALHAAATAALLISAGVLPRGTPPSDVSGSAKAFDRSPR